MPFTPRKSLRTLLLLLCIFLCGCVFQSEEDASEQLARELASRIPADSTQAVIAVYTEDLSALSEIHLR